MGRAYEVRKASIEKNGQQKAKLYSMYAREIYQAAKNNPEIESNDVLKRLVDKAKKEQVPADIINRAIDKVKKGVTEDYQVVMYEGFGPGGSTVIVKCLTDNVNRSMSLVRPAFNKTNSKMAGVGAVSYMYDNLCVVGIKDLDEEKALEIMVNNDINIDDIEVEDGITYIYGDPKDLFTIKKALESEIPNIKYEMDEIGYFAKEMVSLNDEDLSVFKKLLTMLDDVEDVKEVFHNVSNV